MPSNSHLLQSIFNHDFTSFDDPADFNRYFFDTAFDLEELEKVYAHVSASSHEIAGKTIPAVIHIPGKQSCEEPFSILAMLHGNEPCGLAGILLAMALSNAGLLERDVIGIVGNHYAAKQYFKALGENPDARQETRDAYRCGLRDDGSLMPDLNRIPTNFMEADNSDPHIKRAQELYHIGLNINGMADLHSARGNMICITDHKRDQDLKFTPIRSVLTELADAISGHASGNVKVQTLKTIISPLDNIKCQVGIEAGKHEEPYAPHVAASFVLSLLKTLGLTTVEPLHAKENGVFSRYAVKPRIAYADLIASGKAGNDDLIYMVTECNNVDAIPKQSDQVVELLEDGTYGLQTVLEHIIKPIGKLTYVLHQYDEMVHIKKDHVVALAIPSGITYKAPSEMWGIFFSKSAALFDKDPAVGPWPITPDKLSTKFCYPCEVSKMKIEFE